MNMRQIMAKGFGGKYFSLQAITATVNAITIQRNAVRTRNCHTHRFSPTDDSIDESPPDPNEFLLEAIAPFAPKVSRCQCHCNCFFRSHAKNALLLSALRPKLRFLFRHYFTDLSPPNFIL
jgi:hypothetical protein